MPTTSPNSRWTGDVDVAQNEASNAILSTPPKQKYDDHHLKPNTNFIDDQTTIVSPSKARADAQRSQEVTLIDSWLESLFTPNQVPKHFQSWKQELSSSKEVLKALQDLQYANLAADKLNELLHEARIDEIATLQNLLAHAQQSPSNELLAKIHDSLSPPAQDALASLAVSSALLGIPVSISGQEPDPWLDNSSDDLITKFGSKISSQTQTAQLLESNIASLQVLHTELQHQLSDLKQTLETQRDTQTSEQATSDHLHAKTIQHNRETKQITQKITEYRDRIAQLERTLQNLSKVPRREHKGLAGASTTQGTAVTVDEVLACRDDIEERKERIHKLEQRMAAFHGLPPDLDASRKEVKRATTELANLQRKREELFERITRR